MSNYYWGGNKIKRVKGSNPEQVNDKSYLYLVKTKSRLLKGRWATIFRCEEKGLVDQKTR